MAIGLISAVVQATALRRAGGSPATALPHSGTGLSAPEQARLVHSIPRAWTKKIYRSTGCPPDHLDPPRGSDVVSLGESAVDDEGCGNADEGEEVFGLEFVAAVQAAAVGQPGHRPFDDPAVSAEPGGELDALACDAVTDATLAKPFRRCS